MTIEQIQSKIRAFRDERDWMQFHNPKDLATAISIEAAELQEHFLWIGTDKSHARGMDRRDKVQEEIADIGIYLFELAENLGIDLLAAMEQKLRKNAEKYPISKAKGSVVKYTEL